MEVLIGIGFLCLLLASGLAKEHKKRIEEQKKIKEQKRLEEKEKFIKDLAKLLAK